MQCLSTFIEKETHNLKISFIYIIRKKNRRMRILSACIFSKFFGGKITPFYTDVTHSFKKTLVHAYFSNFFGGKNKTKLNGNYLGNSLDEKSWLALTKRIFCWKIFQRTERKSQQFCFTGLLLDSTLVQSDKKKGFWKCDELSLKVDFSRDCCKNLSSTSALRFSLTWKIITLKCLWLIPTSVIQQSVKNNTNKNNQQMNQTQLVLHSNNLANVIKHEFYHTDKVQLLKFNSFRISLHFCIYTLRWNTLTSFSLIGW